MKPMDLVGLTFNRLTVLSFAGIRRTPKGKPIRTWAVKCACGKELVVTGERLVSGNTKSCGCARKGNRNAQTTYKGWGVSATNALYLRYANQARSRGYSFEISREWFADAILDCCFYCASEPDSTWSKPSARDIFTYNGIDRVDNSIGYVITNLVTCCTYCNRAKSDQTLDEFIGRIRKIHERHG